MIIDKMRIHKERKCVVKNMQRAKIYGRKYTKSENKWLKIRKS